MVFTQTRYTRRLLREAVKGAVSIAEVLRRIGRKPAGSSYYTVRTKLKRYGISTRHLLGQSHARGTSNMRARLRARPVTEYLKKDTKRTIGSNMLRKKLIC